MDREEQLALLIDLENFFLRRTTEFIKVNLKELGERSKEIFEFCLYHQNGKQQLFMGLARG